MIGIDVPGLAELLPLGRAIVAAAMVGALSPGWARAADLAPASAPSPYVVPAAPDAYDPYRYELRLGGFFHSVGGYEKGTYDLGPELVFPRLPFYQSDWWAIFIPRPHVGALINLDGRTSAVYAGALWSFPITSRTFFELFLDGAAHNGYDNNAPLGRTSFGCAALFHLGGSLGYAITEHWTAMVTFDHLSNGHGIFDTTCPGNSDSTPNPGQNDWGAKIGYAF